MAALRARADHVVQRSIRLLIALVMASLVVAIVAVPSRAANQTWGDVATTINGLIDEGVSTFKAGDAKGGKDKVNDAYYKHYEITRYGEAGYGPHLWFACLSGRNGVLPPQEGHDGR